MPYGLIYQGEFDSIAENGYRLEILKKDYTGGFTTLPMAGLPVVQNWATDEIKTGIKACNLTINYLNKGSNPIERFYSNNDDEFMVIFYQDAQVLFCGFLVQDDIREPMLDYTHEVQLSASDNLGLLKDIELDKYPLTASAFNTQTAKGIFTGGPGATNLIQLRNTGYVPAVGVPFIISGHPDAGMNITMTPIIVNMVTPGNYNIFIAEFTGTSTEATCLINSFSGFDFYRRNSLLSVIAVCLRNTGLELETYIYENIYESVHDTASSSLEQTYIDVQSFISGDKFENCNDVLTKICAKFHLTVFQSLGRWNIIRWDELRQSPSINGFIYDYDFVLTGTTALDAELLLGFQEETYPETGLAKSAVRPFEFVKETFNYQVPKYLLQNYDLQRLGTRLRQYMNGTTRITEYTAIGWLSAFGAPSVERFIRVEYDTVLQRESDRYLVLRGPSFDAIRCLPSMSLDCNIGDRISFSCSFRTNISQPSPVGFAFAIYLTDGTTNRYLRNDGSWTAAFGFNYVLPPGENTNQWHSIDTERSSKIPFTGVMTVFLPQFTQAPQTVLKECHFKDMRFEYTAYINDSVKIIGHIHKDIQDVIIKNNEDLEIYMDDSPRSAVQGTLFRNLFTGVSQQRTSTWHRDGVAENRKLGEITTIEQLQWRSVSRTRLDGSFRGLIQSGQNISMLNHFEYAQLPGLNFLFGSLQIDYRNDRLTCSAIELFKTGEADVAETYSHTYIYDAT